jgi:type II secretory pathway pseudopilin PulG
LLEVVVAVAILSIAVLPILWSFAMAPSARQQAGRTEGALAIARGCLERLHALKGSEWDAIPPCTTDQPEYTVQQTVTDRPGVAGLKDVTVTVSWTDLRGEIHSVTLSTSVARRP